MADRSSLFHSHYLFFSSACMIATILKPAMCTQKYIATWLVFEETPFLSYHPSVQKTFPVNSSLLSSIASSFLVPKAIPYLFTFLSSHFLINMLYTFLLPIIATPVFPALDALSFPAYPFFKTHLSSLTSISKPSLSPQVSMIFFWHATIFILYSSHISTLFSLIWYYKFLFFICLAYFST